MSKVILYIAGLGLIIWFSVVMAKYQSDNQGEYKEYIINSIRVDDDGEYHIVAFREGREAITLCDVDASRIYLYTREQIAKPTLKVKIGRDYVVSLPASYKIETFDD